jgi:phosphohistidine phosphatase
MYLYLVRHGEALSEKVDPERHLSEQGMLDVSEMAAFMACAGVKVDQIWHSSKERARRTARIIAEAVPHKNMVERQGLSPNAPVAGIAEEIGQVREDLMIVGHLPFLDLLAARLLTGNDHEGFLAFAAGGAACLEKWEGGWKFFWMMEPAVLAKCTAQG